MYDSDSSPGPSAFSLHRPSTVPDVSQLSVMNSAMCCFNLIKIDTRPFIQALSMHFKVIFLNTQSARHKTTDIFDHVMLDLKLEDKIPCSETRKRTKIIDIIEYTLKQKWKWAGHIARLKDNRWTRRCTEWQPRRGKRSRGRPSRRWQDDITEKEGTTWIRKATDRRRWKTLMEGYILQWMDKA